MSALTQPLELVDVLRACCGALPLATGAHGAISGTGVSEAWAKHLEMRSFATYLLLLEDEGGEQSTTSCSYSPGTNGYVHSMSDAKGFFTSRKLVFELFYTKLEELCELCTAWTKRPSEGGLQISLDRFRCLFSACIVGALLLPQFADLNTSQSESVETQVMTLADSSVRLALNSVEPLDFEQMIIKSVRSCIPSVGTVSLSRFQSECPGLLRFLNRVGVQLDQGSSAVQFGTHTDVMDLDDEFDSQSSRVTASSSPLPLPRLNAQLATSTRAFNIATKQRLALMRAIDNDNSQIGLLPDPWLNDLLALPDDDLLCCQELLLETFRSDVVVKPNHALQVIERVGSIISAADYQCCEVALTLCVDMIDGLHHTWLNDNQDLAESVGDLYNYFVTVCLPLNLFSPRAQISFAGLLFTLLRVKSDYGTLLGLDSCRTTLLNILTNGTMQVKCFVADRIADIFDLFILMLHDEIFVDVLASLPINPEDASGIAFRLFTLAKLACRWPTLLRRCIYHIFETPGKIQEAKDHARWCMVDIAKTLNLESPKTLFNLFSRQLLYTWMEHDSIQEIPFSIFGFDSLGDLLSSAQSEAIALAIMRGQDAATAAIARSIDTIDVDLIRNNVAASLAYSMPFSDMTGTSRAVRGEDYIRKKLGDKGYAEAVYISLIDTVATLFDLIDQEDNIAKMFRKHEDLAYAATNLDVMNRLSHSGTKLPPNQQPMFHAKYVMNSIFRLCQGTEYRFQDLWTPAVILSITRSLLNTVHSALGSLHACSVLRKVRLVVCLAGPTALTSYCLEMLLNAVRGFIVDPECADDALGLSQYLLEGGAAYLTKTPSFLAGYSLSTLASLRVFLESSQSSTTQESQFKATMSKAQNFHDWFTNYLSEYESSSFRDHQQSQLFSSITHAASRIRSSGNAERDTAESKLLLDILKDGTSEGGLLNTSSKDLALKLLCGDFTIPISTEDVVDGDASAKQQAPRVWKSCKARHLSKDYLSWAGRVVGRAFAASGDIPDGVLQECQLANDPDVAAEGGSEIGILSLLQELNGEETSVVAGMAEEALRTIVSRAVLYEDEPMTVACQKGLPESLFLASQWSPFRSPQLELPSKGTMASKWEDNVASTTWLKGMSSYLACAVPESIFLSALPEILSETPGLSAKAFPFLVHIVLSLQLDQQQKIKRKLSTALKDWLKVSDAQATDNVKLLIKTILYLRTQPYPKESSIADRTHWLDVDYVLASSAASRCGMQKTALLFAELSASESSRSSRRSSTSKESDLHGTLLNIFENIDDPDTYYGLSEEASLSTVLARIEYENEGSKSLAFRGARYDTHLRLGRPEARQDGQAIVRALGTLGLSGLSQSVLQRQQDIDAETGSTESTFHTARRLGLWSLPAPAESNHAVVLYQAYQSMHHASNSSEVQKTLYTGFGGLMKDVVSCNFNATGLRNRLAALASLSELDDLLNVSGRSDLEKMVQEFKTHSQWMRRGM